MLSKKEYFASKSASPKWAKLSSAEKEQRYKSYRESRDGQEKKGMTVRRPAACSNSMRIADAFVPGPSANWLPFDRTPTLRRTHVLRSAILSNGSGEAGFQILPSFCGSSASYVFSAPTFAAGVVSTWNAGLAWVGTTGLERVRVLGASVSFTSSLPSLSDQGIVTAGFYAPGVSAADAPFSSTEILRCASHFTGRNSDGFFSILPPGTPEGMLAFNEKTQSPVIQGLGSRPGFVAIWTGLPFGATVGYLDLMLTVEETSASPSSTARELLSVPEPVPGALDALLDVISGFDLTKAMGAVKQTVSLTSYGRELIASLATPVLVAHAQQYRALH